MNQPTEKKPKHQIYTIDGPMPFEMYCAGEGQAGGGYLVFEEWGVRVVLKPEAAWRTATKAKRKASNKLTDAEGNWNIWFLLARALVLSLESLEEAERGIGPADTMQEATNQLRSAGKARAMAADARQHALLQALTIDDTIPIEVAMTERTFIVWFEALMAKRLAANDTAFVETVNGFIRAANGLQKGYPSDVLQFSRVLAEQARLAGGPPTKANVRQALGVAEAMAENVKQSMNPAKLPSKEEVSIWASQQPVHQSEHADLIDPNTFTRLLERSGFGWLPNGKTGPQRQVKSGKGRSVALFDFTTPKRKER